MAMALAIPPMVTIAKALQPRPRFAAHGSNQSFVRNQRNLSITMGLEAKKYMSKETYEGEFEAAIEAVERACRLCLNVRTKMSAGLGISMEEGQRQKDDLTPVTVADYGVQALVALELGKRFQGVPLLGEEDAFFLKGESGSESGPSLATVVTQEVVSVASLQLGTVTEQNIMNALEGNEDPRLSDTYWILDPIDGTRGFVRGGDSQCVVGLALVHEGELVAGVMGLPFLPLDLNHKPLLKSGSSKTSPSASKGILLAAIKNGGTWTRPIQWRSEQNGGRNPSFAGENGENGARNGMERVYVRRDHELANACVCISDHETWDELPLAQALKAEGIGEGLARNLLPLCCGSLCKYAAVALGEASVFIQHPVSTPSLKVWDHAAGIICVEEAGGQVSDFKGESLLLEHGNSVFYPGGGGVIVSNGELHSAVVERVRKMSV